MSVYLPIILYRQYFSSLSVPVPDEQNQEGCKSYPTGNQENKVVPKSTCEGVLEWSLLK